jgi:hypothetical protein
VTNYLSSNCDSGADNEASIIHEELVVSGCNPSELLELTETALDEVPLLISVFVDWDFV